MCGSASGGDVGLAVGVGEQLAQSFQREFRNGKALGAAVRNIYGFRKGGVASGAATQTFGSDHRQESARAIIE